MCGTFSTSSASSSSSQIIRVSHDHPCEICHKPDWCGFTSDGRFAICMRIESDTATENDGWGCIGWVIDRETVTGYTHHQKKETAGIEAEEIALQHSPACGLDCFGRERQPTRIDE